MTVDPIVAIESLGYTEREAAFLYLVAVHSGYFLRRQFDYFIDRNKGAIVMHFLEKARIAGHIEFLDYKQGWHVYHLFSRAIYRLIGEVESQNRRRKGDAQVRARLMTLDYVLENNGDHYLESEAGRIRFFEQDRRLATDLFTGEDGRLYPLLAAFPLSLTDRTRPAQSLVRVAFIDEGFATIEKFLRFLSVAEPLLRALQDFELIYVGSSDFNFQAAKAEFWKWFSSSPSRSLGLFDKAVPSVTPRSAPKVRARFTTFLLGYSYPKLQRSEVRGSTEGSHVSS
jgi:hypothetical protein